MNAQTLNAQTLCRRVAKAIIERCRRDLYAILAAEGYEFAQCDSPRIRKVKGGNK